MTELQWQCQCYSALILCMYVYIYVCICMHACIYIYMHVYIYIYTCMYTNICTCERMYLCMYVKLLFATLAAIPGVPPSGDGSGRRVAWSWPTILRTLSGTSAVCGARGSADLNIPQGCFGRQSCHLEPSLGKASGSTSLVLELPSPAAGWISFW